MKGIAVFYKPKGWSSYDLIRFLKKKLNEEKIGHGGTLDPIAEGVLIIGIGKTGTKKLTEFLKGKEKEYVATIALGAVSDTFDAEGKITRLEVKEWPKENEIKKCLKRFEGKFLQTPPAFSAVKISGTPAYKLARSGKNIEIQPKKVEVLKIEFLDYQLQGPEAILKVKLLVKSGFYVRSFANDLGKILKTGGYLKELVRTKVGRFTIKEAITTDDFEKNHLELYFKAKGWVQGVGFRFFAQKWANLLRIKGKAENLDDGGPPAGRAGIEIIGQSKEKNLQEFLDRILEGPPMARVEKPFYYFRKPQIYYSGFEIY
jgi:tRNA pseudouridine55 synthase